VRFSQTTSLTLFDHVFCSCVLSGFCKNSMDFVCVSEVKKEPNDDQSDATTDCINPQSRSKLQLDSGYCPDGRDHDNTDADIKKEDKVQPSEDCDYKSAPKTSLATCSQCSTQTADVKPDVQIYTLNADETKTAVQSISPEQPYPVLLIAYR
jgi:hypothetical protein